MTKSEGIMEEKIKYAVDTFGMDKAYGRVIIGLSGGADSTLLLHHFAKRAEEVLCVHVNHMIRGAEADRDERFCRELCKELGVELLVCRIDIPALSRERGTGVEETAREERYRVFNEELKKRGFDAILTAHNADDNIESIIFNLARGSGINGLSGIKPKNGNIYRPLINLPKSEIVSYLDDNNIKYVTDSTNSDVAYTRNYIRHKIVPELRRLNPALDASVTRMSASLRQDEELILGMADSFVGARCQGGCAPLEEMKALHASVRARVLKLLAEKSLDFKSIKACEDIIFTSECGSYVNLSGGISFKKERDYVHFMSTEALCTGDYSYPLTDGVFIKELGLYVSPAPLDQEPCLTVRLRADSVCGALTVRSKRDGDIIKSGGITKKLKRIFCDRHIPSHERGRIPIIEDECGIVAVGDICIRDGCRPTKDSEILTVAFYRFDYND